MNYQVIEDGKLYLLSIVEFNIDDKNIKFYGGFEINTDKEIIFQLANKMTFDPKLLPYGDVTKSIENPLGMFGINLDNLDLYAKIYKGKTGETEADISLYADSVIPKLNNMRLSGAIVFKNSTPTLALAALEAVKPVSLTQFISSVLGETFDWADSVTDQFAFYGGYIYSLKSDENFDYTNPVTKQVTTCVPGYNVQAVLRIFDKFDFEVRLTSYKDYTSLITTYADTINIFDFIELIKPSIEYSMEKNKKYLRISSDLELFSTKLKSRVEMSYVKEGSGDNSGQFNGEVSVDLGNVDIPTIDGSSSKDVDLDIKFAWNKSNGFKITDINNIPVNDLDIIEKYSKILNQMKSKGCEELLTKWLNSLEKTKLSPAFKPKSYPSRINSSQMKVPLILKYQIVGIMDYEDSIPFDAVFNIPKSLHDLPSAIWGSVISSMDQISEDILTNPKTYKIIAIEIGKKVGAKAAARFICRALRNFAEDIGEAVAEELAADLAGVVAVDLAGEAELAAVLTAVALLGLPAAVAGIVGLLKSIWDWITGEDKKKKKEAEEKLEKQKKKVEAVMNKVFAKINIVRDKIALKSLNVSFDGDNVDYRWETKNFPDNLGENAIVKYRLKILDGEAGDEKGKIWKDTVATEYSINKNSILISEKNIPDFKDYKMNASLCTVLKGIKFLNSDTEKTVSDSISKLRSADNGKATEFANYLQGMLNTLKSYNENGITTDPVYAKLDTPMYMTVGQSYIGLNTRIKK